MVNYHALIDRILTKNFFTEDRTGVGTFSVFGPQLHFHLGAGLPLLTTKKIHTKSVIHELLWMISGQTNIKYLKDNGVRIWNDWADADGNLGPVYGKQWRRWGAPGGVEIDQLAKCIAEIKSKPHSRRLLVSAWNVGELDAMALPPCPVMFQFYVEDGTLSCKVYQRSADCFLGLPFDIASYAILTHMVARECGLEPAELIMSLGNAHIYSNHVEQCKTMLKREIYESPALRLNPLIKSVFDYTYDDIDIVGYKYHPELPAPIAV